VQGQLPLPLLHPQYSGSGYSLQLDWRPNWTNQRNPNQLELLFLCFFLTDSVVADEGDEAEGAVQQSSVNEG